MSKTVHFLGFPLAAAALHYKFLIEMLTRPGQEVLSFLEIWNKKSMTAVLGNPFTTMTNAAPVQLPGDVTIVGYESQPYRMIDGTGHAPDREVISEQLVRMLHADGRKVNNQRFFESVHQMGIGPLVDETLLLAGIDYAVADGQFKDGKTAAYNMFTQSLDEGLLMKVGVRLANHGLDNRRIVIELLEYETPITRRYTQAVEFGHKIGMRFVLDDVDPRESHDRYRVAVFGKHCEGIKMRREVMRDIENGTYQRKDLERDLAQLLLGKHLYIVFEGVPESRQHELKDDISSQLDGQAAGMFAQSFEGPRNGWWDSRPMHFPR